MHGACKLAQMHKERVVHPQVIAVANRKLVERVLLEMPLKCQYLNVSLNEGKVT
jgi:hypothetical protein